MESAFIICRFYICKSTYSLKCISNIKVNTLATLCVTCQCVPYSKRLESSICIFLAEVSLRRILPCFSSHTVKSHAFCYLFSAVFSTFVGFMLLISLFKVARKHNAELLCGVSKYKKAV